jgi:ABC-type lipoprotein release transport system permease subunit
MAWYPLANVMHHKLSSVLSALGIGIGVCMMITLTGLTRGSLYEVARRWESVDADLIVYPKLRQDVSMLTGAGLSDQYERVLPELNPGTVAKAAPVFFWRMKLAGQDQTVAGVQNKDLPTVSGGADALQGRARFTPRTDWQTFWNAMVARQRADWIEKYGSEEGFLPDPRP